MKAFFRVDDLKDGKISHCTTLYVMDDNKKVIKDFNPVVLTPKGYISSKSYDLRIELPEYEVAENGFIGIFSIPDYELLRSKYDKDYKVWVDTNKYDDSAIRNLAMCKHMNDPYDHS